MAVVPSALTVFDSDQVLDCSGFIEPLPLSLDLFVALYEHTTYDVSLCDRCTRCTKSKGQPSPVILRQLCHLAC